MNLKQLILLGTAALVVVVLAWSVGNLKTEHHEHLQRTRLYPNLEGKINEISHLNFKYADEHEVNIERERDGWLVAEKAGYAADIGRLRELLLTLARLETIEAKTRNPANYDKLGVEDIDKAGSEAQRLRIMDKDAQLLVDVLVGKTSDDGGSYVRKSGEKQSWLTSDRLSIPNKVAEWLDKTLITLDNKRIKRIEIESEEGQTFVIGRSDPSQSDFQLDPMPVGKRLKAGEARRIAAVLSNLTLSDVLPHALVPDGAAWRNTIFKTFDGLIVKARSAEIDDKHYLSLETSFDSNLVERDESKEPEVEPAQAPQQHDARSEAELLGSRFDGWTYVIPSYQGSALGLNYKELIEDEEEEDSKTNEGEAEKKQ